jgi:hypothetical protein
MALWQKMHLYCDMKQGYNCSTYCSSLALLRSSLLQIKIAIIWQLRKTWPFASNFDVKVVDSTSNFDVGVGEATCPRS